MQPQSSPLIVPVLLAGGRGERLWPFSTSSKPKQFVALDGKKTLLEQTLERSTLLTPNHTLVIGNSDQRFLLGEEIHRLGINNRTNILLEPSRKDTAISLAVAVLQSLEKQQDPVLCVMPVDSAVLDVVAWKDAIDRSVQAALLGYLTVIGLKPKRPETSYGYIEIGKPIEDIEDSFLVSSFKEKPDLILAEEFVKDFSFLWNSGMFVVRASVLKDIFEKYAPVTLKYAEESLFSRRVDLDFTYLGEAGFKQAPSISFDYAVMEHIENAAVIKADFGWSDLGNWKTIKELSEGDSSGNVVDGPGYVQNGKNNYLKSDNRIIAVNGLDNVAVIASEEGILVSSLDKLENLKELVKGVEHLKPRE